MNFLNKLGLTNTGVSEADARELSKLKLVHLELIACRIADKCVSYFCSINTLIHLKISFCENGSGDGNVNMEGLERATSLEHLTIIDSDTKYIPLIIPLANLVNLNVCGVSPSINPQSTNILSAKDKLESIVFDSTISGMILDKKGIVLPSLKKLDIITDYLSRERMDALSQLHNLTDLTLSVSGRVVMEGKGQVLSRLEKLSIYSTEYCIDHFDFINPLCLNKIMLNVAGIHTNAMQEMSLMKKLDHIRLLTRKDVEFAHFMQQTFIEHLWIISSHLNVESLRNVTAMNNIKKLTIDFGRSSNNSFYTIKKDFMECFRELSNLNELVLRGALLEYESLEIVSNLKNIQSLNITSSDIDKEKTLLISAADHLTSLVLCHNNLDEKSCEYIGKMKNLTCLDLSVNRIGDKGLFLLTTLSNLRNLTLISAKLTDEGARHLLSMHSLERLDVRMNDITCPMMRLLNGVHFCNLEK